MDRWDYLSLVGAALVVAGVAFIYWPAAMILAGIGLLVVSIFGPRLTRRF